MLLALSDKRRRMSIAQVSHRTGIPRAAVRRSLHTLTALGFVAVDEARRFYLRPRVLSFSHGYLSASPLVILAQPILDRLGESLREAVSLATLDGDEIVYLARSSSSRIMSPTLNVGRRLPAYCIEKRKIDATSAQVGRVVRLLRPRYPQAYLPPVQDGASWRSSDSLSEKTLADDSQIPYKKYMKYIF